MKCYISFKLLECYTKTILVFAHGQTSEKNLYVHMNSYRKRGEKSADISKSFQAMDTTYLFSKFNEVVIDAHMQKNEFQHYLPHTQFYESGKLALMEELKAFKKFYEKA